MRILVIDDDFVSLQKMAVLLGEYGTCDQAQSAKQAMEMLKLSKKKHTPYDLMMIDINLPDVNGLDLMRLIDQKERSLNLGRARKVVVTSESTVANVQTAHRYKCDSFIVKPVTPDIIRKKMIELGYLAEDPEG